jgi:hypothetical protein
MSLSLHEYQAGVKHRLQLTIPMTIIVESGIENPAIAQAEALQAVAGAVKTGDLRYLYSGSTVIRGAEFSTVQFKNLPLLPIPEEIQEPEAE